MALRAVLAEIRRAGVDRLGDVAKLGPRPNAVIEILGELGCPCIMGNHDEFLLDAELVHTYSGAPQVVASINWTRCRLSRLELDFLRGFERSCEITLAKSTVQLLHGFEELTGLIWVGATQGFRLGSIGGGHDRERMERRWLLGFSESQQSSIQTDPWRPVMDRLQDEHNAWLLSQSYARAIVQRFPAEPARNEMGRISVPVVVPVIVSDAGLSYGAAPEFLDLSERLTRLVSRE